MSEYNISTLITIMMDCFADTQINTGTDILETVAKHSNVLVDVDARMISNLMTRKADVHKDIKSGAGKKEVIAYCRNKVKEKILPRINPVLLDDTCDRILESMRNDKKVSDGFCNKMQQLYANGNSLDFFTDAILYALSKTNLPPEASVQPVDFVLLKEADYKCPLNGVKLWKKSKGKYSYTYQIVKIYPEGLDDDMAAKFNAIQPPPRSLDLDENKIILCRDCAENYLSDPQPDEYERLLRCKGTLEQKLKKDQISSESGIEDEIVDIIKAIASIDSTTELRPFTKALKIKEKILPENYLLEVEIHDDVVKYYPFIEKQFSLLDGAENATFNVIRSEVAACYEKYEQAGLDQRTIYDELSEWILSVKGLDSKHKIAARIVISFFVQVCAVFKPYGETDEEESET